MARRSGTAWQSRPPARSSAEKAWALPPGADRHAVTPRGLGRDRVSLGVGRPIRRGGVRRRTRNAPGRGADAVRPGGPEWHAPSPVYEGATSLPDRTVSLECAKVQHSEGWLMGEHRGRENAPQHSVLFVGGTFIGGRLAGRASGTDGCDKKPVQIGGLCAGAPGCVPQYL